MTPVRVCVLLIAALFTAGSAQEPARVTVWLDQYQAGSFDAAVSGFDRSARPKDLLGALRQDGRVWTDQGPAAERARRRLAAATFALEIARLHARETWKIRIPVDQNYVLEWQPAPLLIEWGCELLRDADPQPAERLFHLAALSIGMRAGDPEFFVGSLLAGEHIGHIAHSQKRFPTEPRVQLAVGIIAELESYPTPSGAGSMDAARSLLRGVENDQDVGAEARLRLGYIAIRQRNDDAALEQLRRVERMTRDPWLLFLARYLSGTIQERRSRLREAEDFYRAALVAAPRASSAALALSALLTRTDRRAEAGEIAARALNAPPGSDPWREYMAADDRFWPELIARLRQAVRP